MNNTDKIYNNFVEAYKKMGPSERKKFLAETGFTFLEPKIRRRGHKRIKEDDKENLDDKVLVHY